MDGLAINWSKLAYHQSVHFVPRYYLMIRHLASNIQRFNIPSDVVPA